MTQSAGGAPYTVLWHPDAVVERDAAWPKREGVAMQNAVVKLKAAGPMLPFPHSSSVQGSPLQSLRELRPRAGRSRWRPLYRQVDKTTFVVLAVAPEAQIDRGGFASAVVLAIVRDVALEDD